MLLDWGVGKICYMTYTTLQITNCWEHFMLSPFAICPQPPANQS